MSDSGPHDTPDISTLSLSTPEPHQETPEPYHEPEPDVPPHRSHNPLTNHKLTSPFKFGSRYLSPTDNIYEYNAWDHVTPDSSFYEYASAQYTFQSLHPVSAYDAHRFNSAPEKWWNRFYSNNTSNFFKDRKWLQQEFPILADVAKRGVGRKVVLEVGAGAGNTAFPILKANENEELMVHAVDFSSRAVEIMKADKQYDEKHVRASVWDVASEEGVLPGGLEEGSVDVVVMVFVFSALSPEQWERAVGNVWRCLKEGGEVCFRDYGKGDLTQVRFKKERLLEGRFYVRGDGTRVYFFEEEELRRIWGRGAAEKDVEGEATERTKGEASEEATATCNGHNEIDGDSANGTSAETKDDRDDPPPVSRNAFEILSLGVDRRMLVNRQKQLKMYRCWIQGHFRKPYTTTPS